MMESDLLNEQINTLTSEYADTFRNINASSLISVDVSSLESEIEALKSELVNAEEDLKWATNLIENAQKDMKEKNMGAIPNDPFFENNNKAKEECKRKVNELKRKIEKKENEIADKKKANSNESEIEKLNSIGDKIRKMVEFQKRNLLDSLNAIEKVKSEMIEKAESGIDPTDREIAKMFVKDNNKKIRELKSRIEVFDSILESLTNVETILQNKNELSSDKIKEYYEFFSNYNKEPIGNEDIEINVTFNKDTGKYTVSCKSGNFELKPGKEFTKDELTEENVNKLLKGFAGAISNNKVLVNANGKRYAGARINNAAESIITAANSLEVTKNLGGDQPPKPPKPNNDQPPKPNNDQPPKPPQNPKDELNKPDIDPVVHRVISSRNRNRKIGWVSDGVAAGIGICTAIAAGPLLGIPLGVAGVAATEAFVNGALAFKTAKIRRTLKKIAKANGLKVVTDHETASVYFCGEKGLDSRLTSADLNGPKEVSEVAKKIQEELDKVFNNDLRGTATKEQKDIFLKHKKSSVIPLSMCEKVTLDNIEAAYQNVGGVYKRENGFKLKDGLKIANDFVKSVKPEQNTELEDVTIEDAMGEEFPNENLPIIEDAPVVDEEKTEQNTEAKEETAEVKVEEPTPVVPEVETVEPEEIIPEIEIPTIDEVKTEEPAEATPEVKAAEPVVEETPVVETTPMEQSEQNVEEDKEKGDYIVNADDLLRELGENITVADELVNEESKGMRM